MTATQPIQVVVAYDFSPSSELALARAVDVPCEHEHKRHREPHCFTYTNRQVILRPNDWPLL